MKVGITGGIGSGKSYVCRFLERRGIEIYDCDKAAKRIIRQSTEIRSALTRLVGADAYLPTESGPDDGHAAEYRLNKAAVSRFLLASEHNAKAIDNIVHPAVFSDFEKSGLLWMESAILFESGINRLVDRSIVVTAPFEVRISRVMRRDGINREQVMQWMDRQMPQDEVTRLADFEIVNDGVSDIDTQIDNILSRLKEERQISNDTEI